MTNTMTHLGCSAHIEYDDEDGIFTGRIAGIRDGVGFHADNRRRPAPRSASSTGRALQASTTSSLAGRDGAWTPATWSTSQL